MVGRCASSSWMHQHAALHARSSSFGITSPRNRRSATAPTSPSKTFAAAHTGKKVKEDSLPPVPAASSSLYPLELRRPDSRDELEEHHAKAVHVGLSTDRLPRDPLRCQVPDGAPHGRQRAAEVPPHQLRHPKVGDPQGHVLVQQDVLRLDVAVYDAIAAAMVQVGQPSSHTEHDAVPVAPAHARTVTEEEAVEGASGHVLVDKHLIVVRRAEPEEPYEVHVLDTARCAHLRPELLVALPPKTFKLLHCHL
uniref:Uncharacterized protein n=1 Tax=Triticum urartu TaxID=4572 RepID=A0A8R7V8A6_TRIUA